MGGWVDAIQAHAWAYLRLLDGLVVVRLDLDQRAKDVLVLVRVVVAETSTQTGAQGGVRVRATVGTMRSAGVRERGGLYRESTCGASSSLPGLFRSSTLAAGFSFHMSSSLAICPGVRWRARCSSCRVARDVGGPTGV